MAEKIKMVRHALTQSQADAINVHGIGHKPHQSGDVIIVREREDGTRHVWFSHELQVELR